MENIKNIKRENVIIEFAIEDTFDCPVGSFAARLHEVKFKGDLNEDESPQQVRLLFVVDVTQIKHKRVLAGKNWHPKSKQLRQFLQSWFGKTFYDDMEDGQLNLKKYIGRPAELVITHSTNKHFDKPFVNIESIHPPGTFKLDKSFKEAGEAI